MSDEILSDEAWERFLKSVPQDITPTTKGPEWFSGFDLVETAVEE